MDRMTSILTRAQHLADRYGWKLSTVSKRLFNDTYRLEDLARGRTRDGRPTFARPPTLEQAERVLADLEARAQADCEHQTAA